ncbi:MAG: heme lyase CcmF/NrfE family subunit [Deltaproteobacteria bacterium]|nr:heme lyase CcmF/NrfE family subunit [Deltaproteobacteria bacterium]
MAAFGNLTLLVSFVVATFAGVASLVGIRRDSERLLRAGRAAACLLAAVLGMAVAAMVHAFASSDFAIQYVQHYSEAGQPLAYKLTAVWGGLDGSLLFWVFVLALCAAAAVKALAGRDRAITAYATVVLMAVCDFFLYLVVYERNPFDTFLIRQPEHGQGLNPLLQNPYMVVHPPSLYAGFVGLSIPYAFAMGALLAGEFGNAWLSMVRRWLLAAWFLLALGLVLGMIWAYEVLGWGGFWGWDPVENAGLLPWLVATALVHSAKAQERRGLFVRWNYTLVILSFFLTIVGTFMTRSGIVQSVHAFGKDVHLAWIFGIFMAVILVFSFGLMAWRRRDIAPAEPIGSLLSREAMFGLANWAFVTATAIVLVATMFPTLSEWLTGERANVTAAFFNRTMVPVGIFLLLLTGVGSLFAWRGTECGSARQRARWPVAVAAATLLGAALARAGRSPAALLCFGVCAFVVTVIVQEVVRATRGRQKACGGSFAAALGAVLFKTRAPHAGHLVHLGVVLMFVGFAGQAFQREENAIIATGDSKDFAGYRLRFEGMVQSRDLIKETYRAEIAVSSGGRSLGRLRPGREYYERRPNEPVSQVAIRRGLAEDLYVTLGSYDEARRAVALKLVINPLVDWMWLGFLVMAFGSLLILASGPRAQVRAWSWGGAVVALGVAALAAVLGKAVLRMPVSAQLATLALCGLSVGLAGLACYRLFASLLLPADGATTLEQ